MHLSELPPSFTNGTLATEVDSTHIRRVPIPQRYFWLGSEKQHQETLLYKIQSKSWSFSIMCHERSRRTIHPALAARTVWTDISSRMQMQTYTQENQEKNTREMQLHNTSLYPRGALLSLRMQVNWSESLLSQALAEKDKQKWQRMLRNNRKYAITKACLLLDSNQNYYCCKKTTKFLVSTPAAGKELHRRESIYRALHLTTRLPPHLTPCVPTKFFRNKNRFLRD